MLSQYLCGAIEKPVGWSDNDNALMPSKSKYANKIQNMQKKFKIKLWAYLYSSIFLLLCPERI